MGKIVIDWVGKKIDISDPVSAKEVYGLWVQAYRNLGKEHGVPSHAEIAGSVHLRNALLDLVLHRIIEPAAIPEATAFLVEVERSLASAGGHSRTSGL